MRGSARRVSDMQEVMGKWGRAQLGTRINEMMSAVKSVRCYILRSCFFWMQSMHFSTFSFQISKKIDWMAQKEMWWLLYQQHEDALSTNKYHDTPRQGWKLNCRQLADYTRLSVAHPEHPHGSPCWLMSSGQSAHGFCATSIWSSIGHIPRVFLTPWMPAALCAMRPLGSYWCACEGWLRGGWSSLQSVSSTLHFSVCRPWNNP